MGPSQFGLNMDANASQNSQLYTGTFGLVEPTRGVGNKSLTNSARQEQAAAMGQINPLLAVPTYERAALAATRSQQRMVHGHAGFVHQPGEQMLVAQPGMAGYGQPNQSPQMYGIGRGRIEVSGNLTINTYNVGMYLF